MRKIILETCVKTIAVQKVTSVKFEYSCRFDILLVWKNTNQSRIHGKVFIVSMYFHIVLYACAWMCTRECKCINIYMYVCTYVCFFRDKHVLFFNYFFSFISGFLTGTVIFDLQFARTRVNYSGSSYLLTYSFILHSV